MSDVNHKVIGYIRVLPDELSSTFWGLEAQRNAITNFVASRFWILDQITFDYTADRIQTFDELQTDGATLLPGLTKCIKLIEQEIVNTLVVLSINRISYSYSLLGPIWHLIAKHNGYFVSISEPALSNYHVRVLIDQIVTTTAASARSGLVAKAREGRILKIASGGLVGRVPYGYKITGVRRSARAEIVHHQAEIVRLIYQSRANGLSLAAIADHLNVLGDRGPTGKGWHPRTIKRVLDNPVYRRPSDRIEPSQAIERRKQGPTLPAILDE